MRYFVIGDDGQKYGPADVLTLQAWVGEGRLLPNQQVEEEGSGIRMAAAAVNGLNFPDLAPPEPRMATPGPAYRGPAGGAPLPPAGSPYEQPPAARYSGDNGANDVTLAWVFAILGLLLCCVFDFPGYYFANRAMSKGNSGGNAPRIFCIVVMCLQVVGILGYILLVVMAVKQGVMPGKGFEIRN